MGKISITHKIKKKSTQLATTIWFRPILGLACFAGWTYTLSSQGYIYQEYLAQNEIKVISGLNLYTLFAYLIGLILISFLVSSSSQAKKAIQICLSLCLAYCFLFVLDHTIVHDIILIFISLIAGCATACYGHWFKQFIPANSSVKPIGILIVMTAVSVYIPGLITVVLDAEAGLFLSFLLLVYSLYESFHLPAFDAAFQRGSKRALSGQQIRSSSLILLFLLFIEIHISYLITVVNMNYTEFIRPANYYWIIPYLFLVPITMYFCDKFRPQQSINYMFICLALGYILYDCLPHTHLTYFVLLSIGLATQGLAEMVSFVNLRHILSHTLWPIHLTGCHMLINFSGRILGVLAGTYLLKLKLFQENFTNIAVLFVLFCIAIFSFWLQKIVDNTPLQIYVSEPETTEKNKDLSSLLLKTLSERETQIVLMMINGKTQKEIAQAISLSENTIKSHTKIYILNLIFILNRSLRTTVRRYRADYFFLSHQIAATAAIPDTKIPPAHNPTGAVSPV